MANALLIGAHVPGGTGVHVAIDVAPVTLELLPARDGGGKACKQAQSNKQDQPDKDNLCKAQEDASLTSRTGLWYGSADLAETTSCTHGTRRRAARALKPACGASRTDAAASAGGVAARQAIEAHVCVDAPWDRVRLACCAMKARAAIGRADSRTVAACRTWNKHLPHGSSAYFTTEAARRAEFTRRRCRCLRQCADGAAGTR
jgi:hypothetical protein